LVVVLAVAVAPVAARRTLVVRRRQRRMALGFLWVGGVCMGWVVGIGEGTSQGGWRTRLMRRN